MNDSSSWTIVETKAQEAGGTTSPTPSTDFFVKPRSDPMQLHKLARKAAWSEAIKVGTIASFIAGIIPLCILGAMKQSDMPSERIVFAGTISVLILGALVVWVVLTLRTKKNWNDLVSRSMIEAKKLLSESFEMMKLSQRYRLDIGKMLEGCKALIEAAEVEFQARRFAIFWDKIEQIATKLAEVQTKIDNLRSLQSEHESRLRGHVHNLPVLLPGCSSIPTRIVMIDRYYGLIQQAQSNIDFALIWEHRQTRAVMVAGFVTLGDIVQNIGQSVQNSLHQLTAVAGAPRLSVGIIR